MCNYLLIKYISVYWGVFTRFIILKVGIRINKNLG